MGSKSFKRKYPDFFRRALDVEERIYLKDCGVIDSLQNDLGLTALKSEDVMELMANAKRNNKQHIQQRFPQVTSNLWQPRSTQMMS